MASHWIIRRPRKRGFSYRVMYRVGGRESSPRYAGAFGNMREAKIRRGWVAGELAAGRVPDLSTLLTAAVVAPPFREKARAWQTSRQDVRLNTAIQHRSALQRSYSLLGGLAVDAITWTDVQRMIDDLAAKGKARETIRKSRTAVGMVLDYAGISPNPARDPRIKLPLEEPEEVQPPHGDHVEAVGWLLTPPYRIGLVVLDATGARVGELAAAKIGDLDEERRAWLVRAAVNKSRRDRWVRLPDDLFDVA